MWLQPSTTTSASLKGDVMWKLWLALCFAVLGFAPAQAQQIGYPFPAGIVGLACAYNASPPAALTGQYVLVQCNANGTLLGAGSGGGGAVTIADGADVTQGAMADAACATDTGTCTAQALAKRLNQLASSPIPAGTNNIGIVSANTRDGSGTAITSTGAALDVNIKSGGATSTTNAPIAPATATATNSTVVGTQYNSTQATFTNGQQGSIQSTARGELLASISNGAVAAAVKAASTPSPATDQSLSVTINAGSNGLVALGGATPANSVPTVPAGYTYGHISTAATTTLKSGAGVLHTVCVNTLGTVASTITVDDATSATTPTIAIINSLALLGCQTYDVAFTIGLTLVTTGTVAPDVTVSFR